MIVIPKFIIPLFLLLVVQLNAQKNIWEHISGNKYDWSENYCPEQPYNFEYHQTLVMKIFLSTPGKGGGSDIRYTFEDVLSIVKQMDAVTRNIPKILYLVGWQYNGHDDLYPAWHEVNCALKRKGDGTGRESLVWLYNQAKKYNTIISLHINMTDAYSNSPLWNLYWEKGFISKKKDASPLVIGNYNNLDACQICYKNEWKQGYSVKRIDELIEYLPFLKDAGTIHIDAFFSRENPYENITQEEEESYQRCIMRYFKIKGIDVTHESFNRLREGKDHFVGLSPWFLWLDFTQDDYMKYPASLVSGAGPYVYVNQFPKLASEQMQLGFLFGMSTRGEDCFGDLESNLSANKNWLTKFCSQFYTGTLAYIYLNKYNREKVTGEGLNRSAYYNDQLTVSLSDSVVKHGTVMLRKGNNMFFPISWQPHREIIAYSQNGYKNKEWKLPENWSTVKEVTLYKIKKSGITFSRSVTVKNKKITLSINPNEALTIVPSGTRIN